MTSTIQMTITLYINKKEGRLRTSRTARSRFTIQRKQELVQKHIVEDSTISAYAIRKI